MGVSIVKMVMWRFRNDEKNHIMNLNMTIDQI